MPMSKNTGTPKINPDRPMASGARFSPNARSSDRVSTSAPPEASRIEPSSVPRPMIAATWPRMPPKPFSTNESEAFCAEPTSVSTGRPAASATSRPTTSSAMNGSTFHLMIMARSRAMLSADSVSSPPAVCCNQSITNGSGGVAGNGRAARRSARRRRARAPR